MKIFAKTVEEKVLEQLQTVMDARLFDNDKIKIMPDTHAGKGIVIGFTAPLTEYVSPAHVGCDIGCSMTTMLFDTKLDPADYKEVEHKIRKCGNLGYGKNGCNLCACSFNKSQFFGINKVVKSNKANCQGADNVFFSDKARYSRRSKLP